MTDAEIEEVRDAMLEQRREIRDDLAEVGVDVSSWSVPDGGGADGEQDRAE